MKLATTTGDFTYYSTNYLDQIKWIHQSGFQYIDLGMLNIEASKDLLSNDNWIEVVKEIKEYASANGIEFIQAHGPSVNAFSLGDDYKLAVQRTKRAIKVCGELGIPNMVMHGGWDEGQRSKEQWFVDNGKFFSELFETMEKYHVNVLHENGSKVFRKGYYPNTGADMREFVEFIDHPLFHVCWDTGHANMEGAQYHEILDIGTELYGLHINDNRGMADEHIIPFMGTVNMDEIMCALKKVGYKGVFTFECCSVLRPDKYWLGNRREYKGETGLKIAPLSLKLEMEKYLYETGKYILESYGEFEG